VNRIAQSAEREVIRRDEDKKTGGGLSVVSGPLSVAEKTMSSGRIGRTRRRGDAETRDLGLRIFLAES
jgi:hypothetical protein